MFFVVEGDVVVSIMCRNFCGEKNVLTVGKNLATFPPSQPEKAKTPAATRCTH